MSINRLALATGMVVFAAPVLAATSPNPAPPTAAESSNGLEEIVVTAQKRSQSANDVGLSIRRLELAPSNVATSVTPMIW